MGHHSRETQMEMFFQEYGLLVAVAVPVVVIVGMQVVLFIAGERGTLLLPSLKPFESIALADETVAEPVAPQPMPAAKVTRAPVVMNDERKAA